MRLALAAGALGLAALVLWRLAEPATSPDPLARSVVVALVAALAALALGGPAGALLAARRVPGATLITGAAAASLAVPPFLLGLAWVDVLGPAGRLWALLGQRPSSGPSLLATSAAYHPAACGLVLGAAWSALPLLAVRAALRRAHPSAVEAARLARGAPGEVRALLALAGPAALAAAALVLALALVERATPLLVLRGLTVPTQVEAVAVRFASDRDPLGAARAALPLCGVALLGLALVGALLAGRPLAARPGRGVTPRPLGALGRALAAPVLALALAPLLLPLAWLATKVVAAGAGEGAIARALDALAVAWRLGRADALRSAVAGATTALLAVALAWAVAWPLRAGLDGRSRRRGLAALVALCAVALAVLPPPLLGAGLFAALARPPLDRVLDGPLVIVLALLLRLGPLALAFVAAGVAALPPGHEAAARLAGRSGLPVALGTLGFTSRAAGAAVYALAVTEFATVGMVEPPGASLLGVFVVNEAHYGNGPELAGLLALLLLVVAAPLALWAALERALRGRA